MVVERLIDWSVRNRAVVALALMLLVGGGVVAWRTTPLDAIPDLSDTQVIVLSEWPGRSPDLVEDQVTLPLVTRLLATPGVRTVRGTTFFGLSFVYLLFDDDTDVYWARSRVLEYLAAAAADLPEGVTPELGPDASGVGWAFQYALVDRSGRYSSDELRSFQDWYLRYWLMAVPGVAEVASVGGHIRQLQVNVDPNRLRALDLDLDDVIAAVRRNNDDAGGRTLELAGREHMLRMRGYARGVSDLAAAVVAIRDGKPVLVRDVADVVIGPDVRRGATDLDGQGEVVGGIVVVRSGQNVLDTLTRVKAKLAEVRGSLPAGVELKVVYDRSELIVNAVDTLRQTLLEEIVIVSIVCVLFLWHFRSALVSILMLPLSVLLSFIPMRLLDVTSNLMSLGGIAISIGDLVDNSVVMVENAHKAIEAEPERPRHEVILASAKQVGPPLFFALLITTVSFLPVFALEAQEGKLFHPLAFTKTFALGWAALLSVTVVPILMLALVRGKIRAEAANPLNRGLARLYAPLLGLALRYRRITLATAAVLTLATVPLAMDLGSEFMPPLNEGAILYMPSTLPGVSIAEAQSLLQVQDRLLKTVPEVDTVFGKVGRADTSTDPAPMTMIETTILLKPRSQWRPGLSWDELIAELDELVRMPGVTNAWTMPIKARIDMLSTGIRTPVGIKVFGPDLDTIVSIATEVEAVVQTIPGARSVVAERVVGGAYLDVDVDRAALARYGLAVADVQRAVESAIGGANIGTWVDGVERYPINVRLARDFRDSPADLERLPLRTPGGATIPLGQVAVLQFRDGPGMIRNENGTKTGWVFVDVAERDVGGFVAEAKRVVAERVKLPPGYVLEWSGQFESMQRVAERLRWVVPATLFLILLLLYFSLRDWRRVGLVMLAVPFALVGAVAHLWLADYNLSVAVAVGLIALVGVAIETGILMIIYLDEAWDRHVRRTGAAPADAAALRAVIVEGATLRLRPKMMTVASTVLGLLPILWSSGTGSDVMRRIAAPMVGGMLSSTVVTLVLIPVLYEWWHGRRG